MFFWCLCSCFCPPAVVAAWMFAGDGVSSAIRGNKRQLHTSTSLGLLHRLQWYQALFVLFLILEFCACVWVQNGGSIRLHTSLVHNWCAPESSLIMVCIWVQLPLGPNICFQLFLLALPVSFLNHVFLCSLWFLLLVNLCGFYFPKFFFFFCKQFPSASSIFLFISLVSFWRIKTFTATVATSASACGSRFCSTSNTKKISIPF